MSFNQNLIQSEKNKQLQNKNIITAYIKVKENNVKLRIINSFENSEKKDHFGILMKKIYSK